MNLLSSAVLTSSKKKTTSKSKNLKLRIIFLVYCLPTLLKNIPHKLEC